MLHTVICLILVVGPSFQGGSGPLGLAAERGAEIVYHFENSRFLVSRIDLTLDADGTGRLVFVRQGISKPVEREFDVTAPVLSQLEVLLGRLDFLNSTEVYQTKEDHSNLGTVTIAVDRAGHAREVTFNYTLNRDMAETAALLRGLANREIYVADLETAVRFQPLDTPKLIDALRKEIELGNITEPESLTPLLRSISDDVSLPLIARNRAGELIDKIESASRKRSASHK